MGLRIFVAATGYFEYKDEYPVSGINDPDNYGEVSYAGVTQVPITAQIKNFDPSSYYPNEPCTGHLEFERNYERSEGMTGESVYNDDEESFRDGVKDATVRSIKVGASMYNQGWIGEDEIELGASMVDKYNLIDISNYVLDKLDKYHASGVDDSEDLPNDVDEDQRDGTGNNPLIRHTWNHQYNPDHTTNIYQDHYSVATMIEMKFPTQDLPDSATIEISTKNILGIYETDGNLLDPVDGAKTSLEINIKNANFIDSDNFDASTPNTIFYTSEDTTNTYEDLHIHPEMSMIKIPENKDYDDNAYYYAEIYTEDPSAGSDTDLFCTIEALQADTTTYDIFINEAIYWSDWESKDTDNNNLVEIPVEKIKVKAAQQYGGWQYTYQDTNEEWSFYMTNDGYGDSGGGGCPYISPWNGTKYKQENNLLVQSEFQSGEVTDYYKLDTNLQQKNGQYSMKIEEFENSQDFIDQMKLYTIDHKEGYKVGVTPEGEYITYKDSEAPLNASYSTGENVLDEIKKKGDGQRLQMNAGSEIVINYGDRSMSRWQFNKLILRSSGFSSHTEGSQIGILADKTSLYVSIKVDGSEWKNVTVTHPRNNPHDYVIPLEDQLMQVLGKGHDLDDFKVKIRSTKDHYIDYVGLDNSAPTTVHVQEADIQETLKTGVDGNTKYLNRSLTADDNAVMHLIPGESCKVNFEVPYQIPGLEERDFIVMVKGFYTKYE